MALTLQWLLDKANKKLNVESMNRETADKVRQVILKKCIRKVFTFA